MHNKSMAVPCARLVAYVGRCNPGFGFIVNARNILYLTGFSKRTFGGEIEKEHELRGGGK